MSMWQMQMVFTTEKFLEVAIESWSEGDLKPRPLISVDTLKLTELSDHYTYHENNVPSRLSPEWLCGNLCTSAHDVRVHIAGTNEPKSAQQAKQGACSL